MKGRQRESGTRAKENQKEGESKQKKTKKVRLEENSEIK